MLAEKLAALEGAKNDLWKDAVLNALRQSGPMRTGDLISALGFDSDATVSDIMTNVVRGLEPLSGSFRNSDAQSALGEMVESGTVVWRRAANLDNWYRLPEQDFPPEAAVRKRSLRQMMAEIVAALPSDFLDRFPESKRDQRLPKLGNIGQDDVWVDFCPFVLSAVAEGWELADGDPICNWCGNTFRRVFPLDVEAIEIAKVILSKSRYE